MNITLPEPATLNEKTVYAIGDLASLYPGYLDEEQIAAFLEHGFTKTWVTYSGSLLIGSLVVVRSRENPFREHLVFLRIHPNFAQSLDESLLDAYLASCKKRTVITYFSDKDDYERMALLISRGFEPFGETRELKYPLLKYKRVT